MKSSAGYEPVFSRIEVYHLGSEYEHIPAFAPAIPRFDLLGPPMVNYVLYTLSSLTRAVCMYTYNCLARLVHS